MLLGRSFVREQRRCPPDDPRWACTRSPGRPLDSDQESRTQAQATSAEAAAPAAARLLPQRDQRRRSDHRRAIARRVISRRRPKSNAKNSTSCCALNRLISCRANPTASASVVVVPSSAASGSSSPSGLARGASAPVRTSSPAAAEPPHGEHRRVRLLSHS
jgi:hypothetical protein